MKNFLKSVHNKTDMEYKGVRHHLLEVLYIWKWFSHTNYNIEYENSKKYPVHFQFKKQRLKKNRYGYCQ